MTNTETVREFEALTNGENDNGLKTLSKDDFLFLSKLNELEKYDFFKEYYKDKEENPPEVIKWVNDKTLQIQNYVGMVKLPSGKTLEILPKVQIVPDGQDERMKLIDMIVNSINPKISKPMDANNEKKTLMDYIIWWFLHHMDSLLKYGVKQDYVLVEENSAYVKGKILFSQNIRHNSALQHRTYIEYEDFTPNCIENRLLHSALLACVKHAQNPDIKQKAVRYCHFFDGIGEMTSLNDFDKWTDNRFYKHYNTIKPLTEIILTGVQPFMTQGKKSIPAILFPMEMVFEKYIAQCLENNADKYTIKTQSTEKKLTTNAFTLKPDIVLSKDGERPRVLDTKWKRLSDGKVSSSDAYQMFAYSQAYNEMEDMGADTVLLYPYNHKKPQNRIHTKELFPHGTGGSITVALIDLSCSAKEIAEYIVNGNYEMEMSKIVAPNFDEIE